MIVRIGFGYDVHRLGTDRPFILGGINIPFNKGCIAHSDGDVLIHAICDALLGASGSGDIGRHFPDDSPDYKDIDSKILLKKTLSIISEKGYWVVNIDSTICLQRPIISEYIPQMQNALSGILEIPPENISIKATTTEKLGFIGKEKGISAYAVVLLNMAD